MWSLDASCRPMLCGAPALPLLRGDSAAASPGRPRPCLSCLWLLACVWGRPGGQGSWGPGSSPGPRWLGAEGKYCTFHLVEGPLGGSLPGPRGPQQERALVLLGPTVESAHLHTLSWLPSFGLPCWFFLGSPPNLTSYTWVFVSESALGEHSPRPKS